MSTPPWPMPWWAKAAATTLSTTIHVGSAVTIRATHPQTSDVLFGLLAAVVVGAVLIAFSTTVQRIAVFSHHLKNPFRSLDKPPPLGADVDIEPFAVDTTEGAQVHGWCMTRAHSMHGTGGARSARTTRSRRHVGHDTPTILYCHGNSGDRGTPHRVELYRRLVVELGFRVVAIDYRGFGSSPGSPSEGGVLADARAAVEWAIARHGTQAFYLWGHSLGGGVATGTALQLQEDGIEVSGLILEGTFTSLSAAMRAYPLAWPTYPYPSLLDLVESRMVDRFENVRMIGRLKAPTLILHGTRDAVVPFSHGAELSEMAVAERGPGGVTFVPVTGFGHCDIWAYSELPAVLRRFVGTPSG